MSASSNDEDILQNPNDSLYDFSAVYKMAFQTKIKSERYFCFSLRYASIIIFVLHWIISLSVLLYVMFLTIQSSFSTQYIFAMILFSIYVMVVTAGFYGILNGSPGCTMLYFVFFLAMTLFYFIFSMNTFATMGQTELIIVLLWFSIVTYSLLVIWRVYITIERTEMQIFMEDHIIPI